MKYILSILFITIGILISFNAGIAELPIYLNYLQNWSLSLIFAHFHPSVYILIALLFLLQKGQKSIYYFSFIFLITSWLEIFITNVFNFDILEIVILITTTLLLTYSFFSRVKISYYLISNKLIRKIMLIIGVVFSIICTYLISPIAQYALINHPNKTIDQEDIALLNKYVNTNEINSQKTVIAFFSTNCYYCYDAAKKIGITQKENSFINVISIFSSTKEDADQFVKDANYHTKTVLINNKDFIKLTDGRYPKFYLIDKEVYSYNASSFQHRVLDILSNPE